LGKSCGLKKNHQTKKQKAANKKFECFHCKN